MKKRIGIVSLSGHIERVSGISIFTTSLVKELGSRYKIDIITEKKVDVNKNYFKDYYKDVEFISDSTNINRNFSNDLHFYERGIELDSSLSLQKSIVYAAIRNYYDIIIVNSYDAIISMWDIDRENKLNWYYYFHDSDFMLEKLNTPVWNLNRYLLSQIRVIVPHENIYERFRHVLKEKIVAGFLHLDIDEIKGAKPNHTPNTLLYSGRWDEGKKPKDYITKLEKENLIPMVLTNSNGKIKFKKLFENKEHYIESNIFSKSKIDFISKAEMMFHPCINETLSYSVLESLCFSTVYVNFKYDWVKFHPFKEFFNTKGLIDKSRETVIQYFENSYDQWINLIENNENDLKPLKEDSKLRLQIDEAISKNGYYEHNSETKSVEDIYGWFRYCKYSDKVKQEEITYIGERNNDNQQEVDLDHFF